MNARSFVPVVLGFAALSLMTFAGCTQNDRNRAARSIGTSEPVLAAKDAVLVAAVKARVTAADVDSATSVWVSAHDGAVMLGGAVRTPADIDKVTEAARAVTGVKSVRAALQVDPHLPTASRQASDLALTTRVMAEIAAQAGINAFSIRAQARAGVVTLEGTVRDRSIESTIVDTTRRTPGVTRVVDRLKVNA
jgi:osmotically-inducible protein OsmY